MWAEPCEVPGTCASGPEDGRPVALCNSSHTGMLFQCVDVGPRAS